MQVESDCSSSRAAIDCSSWQRRLYQQSERFTVWPIYSCYNYTHRNHACKHTAGGRREVCNQTYIQRSKQTVECRLTADDNKLNSRRNKTLIHVVCIVPTRRARDETVSWRITSRQNAWFWLVVAATGSWCVRVIPGSEVSVGSVECFSDFQLIVLILKPKSLLFSVTDSKWQPQNRNRDIFSSPCVSVWCLCWC